MTTESPSSTASAADTSAASASVSADSSTSTQDTSTASGSSTSQTPESTDSHSTQAPSIAAASTAPTYTPNFKYKAALQEKELDEFWRPLIKDADSEKKVKEIFTKVDAFDFMKGKKESLEQEYQSLYGDFQNVNQTVSRFNQSVKEGDLSSAFRLAGITKEQIFQWTQQQLQLMEMSPEQRAQFEQYEAARQQKYDLEEKVSYFQQQFEQQAVQARAVQLDVALMRPDVAKFAEGWDRNADSPGAFKQFVIEEAKKVYYDSGKDLSADEAIGLVMQRFGKFLSVGDTTVAMPSQAAAAPMSSGPKPVIPNITGKAASPIKKVPTSLAELRKIAKEKGA